jgi:hypothetical protein
MPHDRWAYCRNAGYHGVWPSTEDVEFDIEFLAKRYATRPFITGVGEVLRRSLISVMGDSAANLATDEFL